MFLYFFSLLFLVILSVLFGEGTEWILNAWDVQLPRAWDYILPIAYFLLLFYMGWSNVNKPKNPGDDDIFPGE